MIGNVVYSIQIIANYCFYLFVELTVHRVLGFSVAHPVRHCVSVCEEGGGVAAGHSVGKIHIFFVWVSFDEKIQRSVRLFILALLGLAMLGLVSPP